MKWIMKIYRVFVILSLIGSFLLFGIDIYMLQYKETTVNEFFFSFIKFLVFAFILWLIDKFMVSTGLLDGEPEYFGFIKKLFRHKKKNGG